MNVTVRYASIQSSVPERAACVISGPLPNLLRFQQLRQPMQRMLDRSGRPIYMPETKGMRNHSRIDEYRTPKPTPSLSLSSHSPSPALPSSSKSAGIRTFFQSPAENGGVQKQRPGLNARIYAHIQSHTAGHSGHSIRASGPHELEIGLRPEHIALGEKKGCTKAARAVRRVCVVGLNARIYTQVQSHTAGHSGHSIRAS